MASPFVALGNSAYQNIFWIFIFLYATTVYLNSKSNAFILLISALLLSPAVQYEYISGGDILANILYFMSFSILAFRTLPRLDISVWLRFASIIFLGVGLASRANYILLMPMIGSVFIRKTSWRYGVIITLAICFITANLILPFYLFDPQSFSPFTVSKRYFSQFDHLLPESGIVISLITIILSCLCALALLRSPKDRLEAHFFV